MAFRREAQSLLDRYYAEFPDEDLARRAAKGLRFLASAEVPLRGQAGEWAAGLVYALAVPDKSEPREAGSLHDDLTRIFNVDSAAVHRRVTVIRAERSVFPDSGV